jgi:ABC-type nickel/cobalt efflux system permease component RcnA
VESARPGDGQPGSGSVPGGVGGDIPELFRAATLTPVLAIASLLLAAALGAGHALTPGHGKTLMAAYLVGSRGTVLHAVGLGLSVTVSHTLGILALALLVTGAEALLPADVVVRTVPLLAAIGFVAIGAWMVISEIRRRRSAPPHVHDHEAHTHEPIEHQHPHDAAHEHPHPHEHDHEPEVDHGSHEPGHGLDPEPSVAAGLEHSHGGRRHRHGPPVRGTITWRSLFALGLAGGIIPSTNALIILLGALVAGRAAFGVALVIAFGLGMALVLGGIGVALVLVRGRLERLPSSHRVSGILANAPLVASVLVLGIGLWLTAQALTALPTL